MPRRWASRLWLAPPALPAALARLLAYALSVSAAVALLNAAPIALLVCVTLFLFTWPETPGHTNGSCTAYAKCSAACYMGGAGVPPATAASHRPAPGTCVCEPLFVFRVLGLGFWI